MLIISFLSFCLGEEVDEKGESGEKLGRMLAKLNG